jgi:hypothetical protein
MHIGLCIVSIKSTSKLKFWIIRTGNKRMTRTDITQPFPSKSEEGLTIYFKYLLDLHSLIFWTGLSLIYPCQHRTPTMIAHSSVCFILRTIMVEIGKWTFKLTRLVDTSSQPFSSFVNSQPFIDASHLPFIMHLFNNAPFYCVRSMIKHMNIGCSFCTTSCSTSWTRLRAHSLTSSSNLLLDQPDGEDHVDKHWIFFNDMCKYVVKHI